MVFIQYFKQFVFCCDCMKTSSKYVMIILLRMSERKISLINDEKAAGPKEIS